MSIYNLYFYFYNALIMDSLTIKEKCRYLSIHDFVFVKSQLDDYHLYGHDI